MADRPPGWSLTVHPLPWRIGRTVGRTIYDAAGNLIGVMDTRALAAAVVLGVNTLARLRVGGVSDEVRDAMRGDSE